MVIFLYIAKKLIIFTFKSTVPVGNGDGADTSSVIKRASNSK